MTLNFTQNPFACFLTRQDLANFLGLPPPGVRVLRCGAGTIVMTAPRRCLSKNVRLRGRKSHTLG